MAIDTREKRQSVVGIGFYFAGPSVTLNATPDVEWRQEAGWGYPGIAPSGFTPAVVSTGGQHIIFTRTHKTRVGFRNS